MTPWPPASPPSQALHCVLHSDRDHPSLWCCSRQNVQHANLHPLRQGHVSPHIKKMAPEPSDERLYALADLLGMYKVIEALSLASCDLPKPNPVLTGCGDSPSEFVHVWSLVPLFRAVVDIHNDQFALDINGDEFYKAALVHIAKDPKFSDISEYLSASSLRDIINIYIQAFQRSEPELEFSLEEPLACSLGCIDHCENLLKLLKLMEKWMAVRAAQSNEDTAEETAQQPVVPNQANISHLKRKFEEIHQERELCGGNNSKLLENNHKLLKVNYEALKVNNEMLKANNQLLNEKCEQLQRNLADMYRMNDTIAKNNDKIAELDRLLRMNDDRLTNLHD